MGEYRQNLITGRWTLFSSDRADRPNANHKHGPRTPNPDRAYEKTCPFCPGNEHMTPPEITRFSDGNGGWSVRVVPNLKRFNSLEDTLGEEQSGIFLRRGSYGTHDVQIDSAQHSVPEMFSYSNSVLERMFFMYRERAAALRGDKKLRSMVIWKNWGSAAWASLEHVHSQMESSAVVVHSLKDQIFGLDRLAERIDGNCGFCYVIEEERHSGERVVAENSTMIALCPYWSKSPFTVYIMPKQHRHAFELASNAELMDFVNLLRGVGQAIDTVCGEPHLNWYSNIGPWNEGLVQMAENANPSVRSSPLAVDGIINHWRFTIRPKISHWAGFEYGGEVPSNSVYPEKAAELLRNALPRL